MFVDNPFKCLSPKNPHMQKMQQQLETFQFQTGLEIELLLHLKNLQWQGFIYLGDRDRVKCNYCNAGLQNWEENDVISHEHAKWYPLCEYLLRRQGVHFVKSVVKKYPNLKRPNITNPTKVDEVRPLRQFTWSIISRLMTSQMST